MTVSLIGHCAFIKNYILGYVVRWLHHGVVTDAQVKAAAVEKTAAAV
jgi:hypothetical protein